MYFFTFSSSRKVTKMPRRNYRYLNSTKESNSESYLHDVGTIMIALKIKKKLTLSTIRDNENRHVKIYSRLYLR